MASIEFDAKVILVNGGLLLLNELHNALVICSKRLSMDSDNRFAAKDATLLSSNLSEYLYIWTLMTNF